MSFRQTYRRGARRHTPGCVAYAIEQSRFDFIYPSADAEVLGTAVALAAMPDAEAGLHADA